MSPSVHCLVQNRKDKLCARLQDDSLCDTSWDNLDAHFLCFSQYQKLLPIAFPYQCLLIYWYLYSTSEKWKKTGYCIKREREREINGPGRNWKQRKQVVSSRNDSPCYRWNQRNRVLISLPMPFFFLPFL